MRAAAATGISASGRRGAAGSELSGLNAVLFHFHRGPLEGRPPNPRRCAFYGRGRCGVWQAVCLLANSGDTDKASRPAQRSAAARGGNGLRREGYRVRPPATRISGFGVGEAGRCPLTEFRWQGRHRICQRPCDTRSSALPERRNLHPFARQGQSGPVAAA